MGDMLMYIEAFFFELTYKAINYVLYLKLESVEV